MRGRARMHSRKLTWVSKGLYRNTFQLRSFCRFYLLETHLHHWLQHLLCLTDFGTNESHDKRLDWNRRDWTMSILPQNWNQNGISPNQTIEMGVIHSYSYSRFQIPQPNMSLLYLWISISCTFLVLQLVCIYQFPSPNFITTSPTLRNYPSFFNKK